MALMHTIISPRVIQFIIDAFTVTIVLTVLVFVLAFLALFIDNVMRKLNS